MREDRRRTAGAFDIRIVIAVLFTIYGVTLTTLGAGESPGELARSAHVNINLYTGIGMLVFAALLALWAWWRPIVVVDAPGSS
jgi:hypothetical protein